MTDADGLITMGEPAFYAGVLATNPEVLALVLWGLFEQKDEGMSIKMPCGVQVWLYGPGAAPARDLPCDCGDPTHWIVKYSDEA